MATHPISFTFHSPVEIPPQCVASSIFTLPSKPKHQCRPLLEPTCFVDGTGKTYSWLVIHLFQEMIQENKEKIATYGKTHRNLTPADFQDFLDTCESIQKSNDFLQTLTPLY